MLIKSNGRFTFNTTARMSFETLFEMLIEANVLPFALAIQCFHENEETVKYFGSSIQLT